LTNRDDPPLRGRVALVTGAGHGIGAGIASLLADRGAAVAVNDVAAERAARTAKRLETAGMRAVPLEGDVASAEDVERLVQSTRETLGALDILVNNAAIFRNKPFLEHTIEDWDRLMAVNLRGVFLLCREVLPGMIERRRGCIVNIASISAYNTTVEHVAYAASKAAVITLTRDLAVEVAPFGVRVNAVAPGPIDSKDRHARPYGSDVVPHVGKPSDIAEAVAFLVSDGARHVVGQTLNVAGGSDLRLRPAAPASG
jgi:NAD(P)-dependent dehydrogenase (short-subunit alcohol dehydrogenase family)